MLRVSGPKSLAVGVVVVLLLAYVVFLPRVLPTATVLTALVAIMGAAFLLVGVRLVITARIPGWLPSRRVRATLSIRLSGFFCVLIATSLRLLSPISFSLAGPLGFGCGHGGNRGRGCSRIGCGCP